MLFGRSIRVFLVEDYAPFCHFVRSTLQKLPELVIIGEVSDGLEAVQKAHELQPDLILLDIGLPSLSGIAAARRIGEVSPTSKILFVSENRSWDIAQEALRSGGGGYVVKSNATRELLPAVEAVLQSKQFVSASLIDHDFMLQRKETIRHHEALFYSHDACFLDGFTGFIGAALKARHSVIVLATESHRDNLLPRLQAQGVDIGAAIEQGRYLSFDAADTVATFMVNDVLDPVRFLKVTDNLVRTAAKAGKGERARVAACGECAPLLWAQGNAEAAIRLEHLWDKAGKKYDLDILCGYSLASFQGGIGSHVFEKISAEHSAVCSR
jgi:DNA-binding NarL/FixJ family response regulator